MITVYCRESHPNGFEHNTFTFVECIKVIRKLPILMMAFLQHIDETGRNGSETEAMEFFRHFFIPGYPISLIRFLQLIAYFLTFVLSVFWTQVNMAVHVFLTEFLTCLMVGIVSEPELKKTEIHFLKPR